MFLFCVYFFAHCGHHQSEQRLLLHTTLTDWYLQQRRRVLTARYELGFK
jgi:hypothetical protein